MLDTRTAQTTLENLLRDTILYALGWRLPAVASVAALRAVVTLGDSSSSRNDDELICVVVAGVVTAAYRWDGLFAGADDGAATVRPNDVPADKPGRWRRWTSTIRFSEVVGGNSRYLHEIATGPLQRVQLLDKNMTDAEIDALLGGQVPAVVIEASDDAPDDATQAAGHRWLTSYRFTVSVLTRNFREHREAAQGSAVSGDTDPGANSIDGLLKALLAGTQLSSVVDGVREVRIGRGRNWISELAQRRVFRSRDYVVDVTEENPAAPNDAGAAEQITAQAEFVDLNAAEEFDELNYITSGMQVSLGVGLAKTVSAGTALIAGAAVVYAGELRSFGAFSDTYRDLKPDGTMTFVEVVADGEEPAVTATALRVGVTRTNGSSVIDDRLIASTRANYGSANIYSLT